MKSNYKKILLLLAVISASGKLLAQTSDSSHVSSDYVKPFSGDGAFRTWSIGISAGVLTPNTLFGSNNHQDFTSPSGNLGYGAYIKKQILPSFGIQANFLAGKLGGDNAHVDATGSSPINSFSTKLHYSGSLNGVFTLSNINWHVRKMGVQPYFSIGVGGMNYTPVETYANGTTGDFKTDNSGAISEIFVPVGAGLKFNIASGINIDLGYQVNFVYSDNLDGYHYGNNNDKFSYAHAGLEFALGGKSKPQLATHNPVASMQDEYTWQNKETRAQLQAQIDAEKAKNDQLQSALNAALANFAKLTMDSDGDGVSDFFDKCPNTPVGVQVDGAGCPLVINVTKPADTKVYITEEDRKVVNEAVKNLEFEFNKATIREHSYTSLDKLADLLKSKSLNLKLAGYTDNVGGVAYNLRLSKERAEAVKTYLVDKGVDASHIQAEGYGKSHPIASNKTAKGRSINRRVEFTIF